MQATSVTVRRDGGPFSYLGIDNDDDSINYGNKEDVINAKTDESSTLIQQGERAEEDNRSIGRRLWARILEEKKQLGQQKDLIAYERRNIELERKQLEYERRNLYARLGKTVT